MNKSDLEYICETIGNLACVPIRIYENGEQVFYHSIVNLPKDPICLSIEQLLTQNGHISYYITPYFYFYGVVSADNVLL